MAAQKRLYLNDQVVDDLASILNAVQQQYDDKGYYYVVSEDDLKDTKTAWDMIHEGFWQLPEQVDEDEEAA